MLSVVNVAFIAFANPRVTKDYLPQVEYRPWRESARTHTGTMHTRLHPRGWSLARQLFALQVVVVAVVVLAGGVAAYLEAG